VTEPNFYFRNFAALPPGLSDPERAATVILPARYEVTASYGRGCREGAEAVVDASRQMEWWDEELGGEPCRTGIHTDDALWLGAGTGEAALAPLGERCRYWLERGKWVVSLGGEHTVSIPLVRAHRERWPDLGILQVDAHADLRPSYEGEAWSHASAMRPLAEEGVPLVQAGLRAVCREDLEAQERFGVRVFWARETARGEEWLERLVECLPRRVYLTLDVDALDPSWMPHTGTPEPGGFSWWDIMALLGAVFARREVVGMDVVEFAPAGNNPAPAYSLARLIYRCIGWRHGV